MAGLVTAALMGLFVWSPASSIAAVAPEAPQAPTYPTYHVAMTGFNAVPEQTDGNPFVTASGAYSDPDIIAARSLDLADELPFGTVIEIDSADPSNSCGYGVVGDEIGLRVIGDTMNARMHNKIDILFGSYKAARTLGLCDVTIKVVGRVDINHVPKTQQDLRLAVGVLEKAGDQNLALSH